MSLLSKIESIFSIVATLDKMQYKFENGAVLKVPKKLVIAATNPLVCYLIFEMSFPKPLLIIKLMFISIEFEVSGKASCNYNSSAKPRIKIRPS